MSYGERIFTQTIERIGGSTVRISILERDYEGAVTRVPAAAVPVVVTSGRKGSELWGQIQGTEIEYRPIAKEPGAYDFLLGGDETQFKLRVRLLSGVSVVAEIEAFVYTDLYEENDNVYPQPVSIRGGDGLGRLDQPYTVVGERRSMAKILADCLKKGGDEWPIIAFDDLKPDDVDNSWDDVEIDDRVFIDGNGDPFTCKEVVQQLLISKGCNIVQGFTLGSIRWIVYDRLHLLGTPVTGQFFDSDGVYGTNFTYTSGITRSIDKALRGVTMRKDRIPRVIDHIYRHGALNGELIRNGSFELVDDGVPINWSIIEPDPATATEFVQISGDDPLDGNNSLLMQSANEVVQPEALSDSRTVLVAPDAALAVNRYELSFSYRPVSPDTGALAGTFAEPPTLRFLIGSKILNGVTGVWEDDAPGKFTWRFGVPKSEEPDAGLREYATGAWTTLNFPLNFPFQSMPLGDIRIELLGATPDEDEMDPGDRLQIYYDALKVNAVSSPFFQSFVNADATRYRVEQGDTTLTFETEGIIGDGPLPLTQSSLSQGGAVTKNWGPDDEPLGIALGKRKMSQVFKGNSVIYGTFTSVVTLDRPITYKGVTYMPKWVEITDIKQGFYTAEVEELRQDIDTVETSVRPLFE